MKQYNEMFRVYYSMSIYVDKMKILYKIYEHDVSIGGFAPGSEATELSGLYMNYI